MLSGHMYYVFLFFLTVHLFLYYVSTNSYEYGSEKNRRWKNSLGKMEKWVKCKIISQSLKLKFEVLSFNMWYYNFWNIFTILICYYWYWVILQQCWYWVACDHASVNQIILLSEKQSVYFFIRPPQNAPHCTVPAQAYWALVTAILFHKHVSFLILQVILGKEGKFLSWWVGFV